MINPFQKKPAFTLLELLIALSLSAFVMFGLMQSYRSLVRYLGKTRELIDVNRRICLLFNQLERDFMTAFIPSIQDAEPSEKKPDEEKKEGEGAGQQQKDEKLTSNKKKPVEKKNFFLAESDESGSFTKVNNKKLIPCKFVTFINSNPLQIYGQRKIRLVRVMYELEKNKEQSTRERVSYNLVRKESRDIDNVKMKINEFDYEKQKNNPISQHVVAEGIKALYVEYVGVKPSKKDDKKGKDEEVHLFSWGDKDFTQGVVPKYVEVYLELWDEQLRSSRMFQAVFPILTFPTLKEKKKPKKLPIVIQPQGQKQGEQEQTSVVKGVLKVAVVPPKSK